MNYSADCFLDRGVISCSIESRAMCFSVQHMNPPVGGTASMVAADEVRSRDYTATSPRICLPLNPRRCNISSRSAYAAVVLPPDNAGRRKCYPGRVARFVAERIPRPSMRAQLLRRIGAPRGMGSHPDVVEVAIERPRCLVSRLDSHLSLSLHY